MSWIFFDAVGTLFGVRGSVGGHYARAARLFGWDADAGRLQGIFQEVFDASPPIVGPDRNGTSEFERQWWKELVIEVCRRARLELDIDAYFEYLFQLFASPRCWQLYPDAAATLKLLAHHGYQIGLISNFDSRLCVLIKELGLEPWIAQVTISSRVSAAKPDPEIFLAACKRADATPGQSWHVGDSPSEDYNGARAAGMRAALLDRDDLHRDFYGVRIRRLSELCGKLRVAIGD